MVLRVSSLFSRAIRATCGVRAFSRSHEAAMEDLKRCGPLLARYLTSSPLDKKLPHFSIIPAEFPGTSASELVTRLSLKSGNPRLCAHLPIADELAEHNRREVIVKADPRQEQIAQGCQDALKRILEAIRNKNLSSLSSLMFDDEDSMFPRIVKESKLRLSLRSLTDQKLSCLEVSDDDFIGLDGTIEYFNQPKVHPSGILPYQTFRWGDFYGSPVFPNSPEEKPRACYTSYIVDMIAIPKKELLIPKMGSLSPSEDLPPMSVLLASIEFAHPSGGMEMYVSDDDKPYHFLPFDNEPKIVNFRIHSF